MPDDLNLAKPAKISGHSDFGAGGLLIGSDPQTSGRLQLTTLPISQGENTGDVVNVVKGPPRHRIASAVVARTVCHRHFTGTVQVVVELLDEIAGQGRGEPRLCQKVGHTVRDTRGTSGIHLCEQ